MAARAVLIAGYQSNKLSKTFTHGLAQLFRNQATPWQRLREQLADGRLSNESGVLDIEAAEVFRRHAKTLLDSRLPAAPSEVERLVQVASAKPVDVPAPPKNAPKQEAPDDTSPAFDLFQRQVQRAMAVKRADTNRIPIHWQRLTPEEARPVLQLCAKTFAGYAENPSQWFRRAIYAAMRILSLQSGLPLRDCMRLPLTRSGDLYLDLERGLIVRDWSRSVPEWIGGKQAARLDAFVPLEASTLSVLRSVRALHAGAITVGQLVASEGITLRMMGQSLNAAWPTSHRPEDARFAASWALMLLSLGVAPGVVARMTGDVMVVPVEDNRYGAIHDDDVDQAMQAFCDAVGLRATQMPHPRLPRGSRKLRPLPELKEVVLNIARVVDQARTNVNRRSSIDMVIGFHNTYATAIALLFEWMHGTRCTKPERRTAEALIGAAAYVCVSDKRTDLYGEARVLPKTSICAELLGRYFEHLRAVAARLSKAEHPAAEQLSRLASGLIPASPIFLLLETSGAHNNRGYRNLRRRDLAELFLKAGAGAHVAIEQDDLNCCRHIFYYELVRRGAWQVCVDSMLGHHTVGAEPHGFFSGVSLRQIADHARPVLQTLQNELGITPLTGLGRTAPRYLAPPPLRIDRAVRPLPNTYLIRKLKDDEELSADVFAREQDPPVTLSTLRVHTATDTLKDAYVCSAAVGRNPAGAVLFCLMAFDAVLSRAELEKLWQELASHPPYSIAAHAVAEVTKDGIPVLQRSISQHTLAAWAILLRHRGTKTWAAALADLHLLLRHLRPPWPGTTPTESLSLLSTMMSHWCAVEVAPGSMFCAYQRAPFVPAKQLARIALNKPCLSDDHSSVDSPIRWRRHIPFSDVLRVIGEWAKPDADLGEKEARRSGCIRDLGGLLNTAGRDFFELTFIDQLIADLSPEAPYKQLSVSTIAQRIGKYSHCYEIFRREATFELDRDAFDDLLDGFGGPEAVRRSDTARWVLLHVGAFLSSRGHSHCLRGVRERALKFTPPLRPPVYLATREVAQICERLPYALEEVGARVSFADVRLSLERHVPSRHSDIKYLRVRDFDEHAGLIHFTSSGHAHLKGGTHGSWYVPGELMEGLKRLARFRLELGGRNDVPLFADGRESDPYRYFDVITEVIRREVITVTGCPEFRRHHFRSAALTDLCIASSVEHMLNAPWRAHADATDVSQLDRMYSRFRLAQRAARHSSAYTTCRHYNVGGVLDLRRELDRADAHRVLGATYVGAVLRCSTQSIHAANHRHGRNARGEGGAALSRFSEHCCSVLSGCRVPELAVDLPMCAQRRDVLGATLAAIAHAVMLNSLGSSLAAITAASGVPGVVAEQAISKTRAVLKNLRVRCAPSRPLTVFTARAGALATRSHLAKKYADWLTEPARLARLRRLAPVITSCVDRNACCLVLNDEQTALDVVEVFTGVADSGARAFLSTRSNSSRIRSAAAYAGVTCLEKDVGRPAPVLRLLFCDERIKNLESLQGVSPRTLGDDGRTSILGLLSAICL